MASPVWRFGLIQMSVFGSMSTDFPAGRDATLDEATSALDADSEHEVQIALERLMKDRTTIVVAHRLTTIQGSDCIHVMSKGKIVESGTHEQLLQSAGHYHALTARQRRNSHSAPLPAIVSDLSTANGGASSGMPKPRAPDP